MAGKAEVALRAASMSWHRVILAKLRQMVVQNARCRGVRLVLSDLIRIILSLFAKFFHLISFVMIYLPY